MTKKKRFVHKYDGMFHHLLDMSKKNFDTQKIQSIDECVDLLNELHEENQQLKQRSKQQLNDITLNWTENFTDFDKDELYVRDNNTEIILKNNNLLISVIVPQIEERLKFHYIVTGRRFERECQYSKR